MFLADLHAHLSQIEVIGFLGGKWEPETLSEQLQSLLVSLCFILKSNDLCQFIELCERDSDSSYSLE
jgi:hypothetical protein